MPNIEPGKRVSVTDWRGQTHERTALSEPVQGTDFMVVWACRPEEWDAARAEGRDPEGLPWPAEDVRPL
jgi:hypothetical protein